MKGGKSGSAKYYFYYQITEAFEPVLSIPQHAGSKDDRK